MEVGRLRCFCLLPPVLLLRRGQARLLLKPLHIFCYLLLYDWVFIASPLLLQTTLLYIMCFCFSSVLHFLPASSQQVKGMKRKKRKEESYTTTAGQKSVDFLFVFMGIFRPAASTINNKQDKNCQYLQNPKKRPTAQHNYTRFSKNRSRGDKK